MFLVILISTRAWKTWEQDITKLTKKKSYVVIQAKNVASLGIVE